MGSTYSAVFHTCRFDPIVGGIQHNLALYEGDVSGVNIQWMTARNRAWPRRERSGMFVVFEKRVMNMSRHRSKVLGVKRAAFSQYCHVRCTSTHTLQVRTTRHAQALFLPLTPNGTAHAPKQTLASLSRKINRRRT